MQQDQQVLIFRLTAPSLIRFVYAGLVPRALLAVFMDERTIQMDAEMPVKPVGRRGIGHVRHGVHARRDRLSVIGHPDRAAVP